MDPLSPYFFKHVEDQDFHYFQAQSRLKDVSFTKYYLWLLFRPFLLTVITNPIWKIMILPAIPPCYEDKSIGLFQNLEVVQKVLKPKYYRVEKFWCQNALHWEIWPESWGLQNNNNNKNQLDTPVLETHWDYLSNFKS